MTCVTYWIAVPHVVWKVRATLIVDWLLLDTLVTASPPKKKKKKKVNRGDALERDMTCDSALTHSLIETLITCAYWSTGVPALVISWLIHKAKPPQCHPCSIQSVIHTASKLLSMQLTMRRPHSFLYPSIQLANCPPFDLKPS